MTSATDRNLIKDLHWQGTFKWSEECQSVGLNLTCKDLRVCFFGYGWIPVDWKRLKETNQDLYGKIRTEVEKRFPNPCGVFTCQTNQGK